MSDEQTQQQTQQQTQTLRDLERHFASKLHAHINDIGSTCEHADIAINDIIKMIMTSLFYELMWTASLTGWNEKEFTSACQIAYRTMMPHIKKRA